MLLHNTLTLYRKFQLCRSHVKYLSHCGTMFRNSGTVSPRGFDKQPLNQEPFLSSMTELFNIYKVVANEVGKECVSASCTRIQKQQMQRCVINIEWPKAMSFSADARNNKLAKERAAQKCLAWLFENNHLNKAMKPIMYDEDSKEIVSKEKFVEINLEPEFKCTINDLVKSFESTIEPLLKKQGNEQREDLVSLQNSETPLIIPKSNGTLKSTLYQRLLKFPDLPIWEHREEILDSLKDNQVLVIKGDTGCGKSTQVPQFILDAHIEENDANTCNIIVSQCRRIAATSLAKRIAWERNESIGKTIGYHVRFDKILPVTDSSITFSTTGMLLERIKLNPTLEGVTHVILDEAHDRTYEIDFLLKVFKDLLKTNSSMKLIIMSATIHTELFQQYYSCKVIDVPGRLYPVKMHFLDDIKIFKEKVKKHYIPNFYIDYIKIVNLVEWIVKNKPPGSILCFLPGWQDIVKVREMLERAKISNLIITALHSKISLDDQGIAFDPAPPGITKIILATNIAENSITITDISYVIDTAIRKSKQYANESTPMLSFSLISKANVLQRKGRAGRVKKGESYHLITKKTYDSLELYPKAEIHTIPLDNAVIISRRISNEKLHDFFNSLPEPPNDEMLSQAIDNLRMLGILDNDDNLTPLGKRVSYLPLDPKLGRAIVLSCIFQCLKPVTLITCLPIIDYMVTLDNDATQHMRIITSKHHNSSDHISALEFYKNLQSGNDNRGMNVRDVARIYDLCMLSLQRCGMIRSKFNSLEANVHSDNNELIRAVLHSGTNHLLKRRAYGFKNRVFTKNANEIRDEMDKGVKLNQTVNCNRKTWPSELLTYLYKQRFSRGRVVYETSMLSPLSVLLFNSTKVNFREIEHPILGRNPAATSCFTINNIKNVEFVCDSETARLIIDLRRAMWSIVNYLLERDLRDSDNELKTVQLYQMKLLDVVSETLRDVSKDIDNC